MGYDFEKLLGPNVSNFALLSSNLFNIISCINTVFFVKITSYAVYIHFRVHNAFLVQIAENIYA